MKKVMLALVVAGLSLVVLSGEAKADKFSQFKGSFGGSCYKQNCYGSSQYKCGYQGDCQSGYQGGFCGKQYGGCVGKQYGGCCPTEWDYGCMPKQKCGYNKQWGGCSQKQY